MGIAGSINNTISDGTYNNNNNDNSNAVSDMIDDFIRAERQKALLSQSSSFLSNQQQQQQQQQSNFLHHVINNDNNNDNNDNNNNNNNNNNNEDIDEYSGDDISLWLKTVGIHPHIAEMTATIASFREIYTPQELYDEWIINRSIFQSLECLNSNDISDILNSRLFRRNIERVQYHIQQSRNDIIQQMEHRCQQIQDVENSLIHEMIQRQIAMESMKEEIEAREIIRQEQLRKSREETQIEMMEILEAAIGTSGIPYHSFDLNSYRQEFECFSELLDRACDLDNPLSNLNNDSPTRAPNDRRSHTKEIINKWDIRMSSPVLDYSSNASSAIRRGNVGNYPAVFVAAGTMNTCLSIRLDECPKRSSLFSFGFTVLCPQSKILTGLTSTDERVFGKALLSWGIIDNRNNNSPSEIWGNNQKCCTCRTLFEGDVLSIRLDILRGCASLHLNGSEIFTFEDLIKNEQYILGTILPVDHKVSIVERDISEPEQQTNSLLRSRTESSIITVSNQSGRNIVLPSPEEILHSSPLNSPIPPSRLLQSEVPFPTSSVRLRRSQQQARTITASSTTSQRIAAYVNPPPIELKKQVELATSLDDNISTVEKTDDSNICCVCLEKPKSTVLLPCRHLCLCKLCGENEDIENCPICRSSIITRMTVFL